MREYIKRPYQFTRLHSPINPAPNDEEGPGKKSSSHKLSLVIGLLLALITLLSLALFIFLRAEDRKGLPANVTSNVQDFTLYYFDKNIPPDQLSLREETVNFSGGLLVFTLVNQLGQTLSITEQKLPDDLQNSTLQGDENFDTTYGKATISSIDDGRTTGSLLTKDSTLILLNSADPIDLNNIKNVLRSLSPVK